MGVRCMRTIQLCSYPKVYVVKSSAVGLWCFGFRAVACVVFFQNNFEGRLQKRSLATVLEES